MKRKLMSLVLLFALITSLLGSSALALTLEKKSPFPDADGHWANAAITVWAEHGVVHGSDGLFRPDAPITRGELAALLNNVIGYQAKSDAVFSDVPGGAWYADCISKLYAAGIMQGDGNGIMRPADNISREEAVVMIARAFDVKQGEAGVNPFPDTEDISDWALALVSGMKDAGYIEGDSAGFRPASDISRAEAVTLLGNIAAGYYSAPGTYEGAVDGNAVVSSSGVTLKDMKINGDLYIMEGVGDGEVFLENVEVTGSVYARGGGANSLYFNNCTIQEFVALKDELHIVLASGCKITILRAELKDATIDLNGCTVETMTIIGDGLNVNIDGESSIAVLNADANDVKIDGASGSTIGEANLNGKTEIKGDVAITEANIAADDCVIEKKPENVNIEDGIKTEIDGKEETGGGQDTPSGGGSSGETAPVFSSHDVPNLTSVPFATEFDQLGLPDEATLTASNGSRVTVLLEWDPTEYDFKHTDGAQTLSATVSAKDGGTLPGWAPGEITVKVTVLPTPTPTTFELCRLMATPIAQDTIIKGKVRTYSLKVKDQLGTVMTEEQLADAGASWTLDDSTAGITLTHHGLFLTVEVASDYSGSEYRCTPVLSYTANGGGTCKTTLVIKTPAPPTEQVAAVTGVELFTRNAGVDERVQDLYVKFRAPADVSDIDCFEVRLINLETSNIATAIRTLGSTSNYEYEFSIIHNTQHLPQGNYRIEVVSKSRDGYTYLDNAAQGTGVIEFTPMPDPQFWYQQETTMYHGIYEHHIPLIIDYHYTGMVVPDIDCYIFEVFFPSSSSFTSRVVASIAEYGRGRIYTNMTLPDGEQVNMEQLQLSVYRYTLSVADGGTVFKLSTSMPIQLFTPQLIDRNNIPGRPTSNNCTHNIYDKTAATGTSFADLNLPTTVQFYAPDRAQFPIVWEESDYDPSVTGEQTIRGYTQHDPMQACPAWVPEFITVIVTLS